MMKFDLVQLLEFIPVSALSYTEWLQVGFALKHEGYTVDVWDLWSRNDKRYVPGDCAKKWNTFNEQTQTIITGATIVKMAKEIGGWAPDNATSNDYHCLDWDSVIGEKDDMVIIDRGYLEEEELQEPAVFDPVQQITKYLETLFEASETVGYVTDSWFNAEKNKRLPTQGAYDRTAGKLIEELNKCNGDIGAVFGDYNPEAGAWIRFNPLDGKGVKNENVTEYRYALVESDQMSIGEQNAILRKLELPIACLVHSGGKSLHAIVRIDAADYSEYRKRVDYLYNICGKNGFIIDKQNKNPSRLSRMPGIMRNGKKQWLVDTNIGKESFREWQEWIESINDDLPDPDNLSTIWNNLPPLSPSLIEGVLRQGHKMLLAGPSKAGKSFLLIELCIAIAEGREWLGFKCEKGKVLYVNLEVEKPSALNRFKEVYTALNWKANNLQNIVVWNLRGKSAPMDKLAPKLIRRAQKENYSAIIIDPIYKVITGDENSADQMAHFCNQFDKICTDLNAAVIYCHHHSKGYQGGKRSVDRASGSGVFARDPDALLDLTELEKTKSVIKLLEDRASCRVCRSFIQQFEPLYLEDEVSLDDQQSAAKMMQHAKEALTDEQYNMLLAEAQKARKTAALKTAWRIEGTLREYARFEPINVWFDYPTHQVDDVGLLSDLEPENERASWMKAMDKCKDSNEKKQDRKKAFEMAFDALNSEGEPVTINDLAEYMGTSIKTVRRRIKEHNGFELQEPEEAKLPWFVVKNGNQS